MRVGIIGAGSMGAGIAQVAATAGCDVKIFDQSENACQKALEKLGKILTRLIEKGRINQFEKESILSLIHI
mgnify:CR=1 FL=1